MMRIALQQRVTSSRILPWLVGAGSLIVALLLGALLLWACGLDPLAVYTALVQGAFGVPEEWERGDFYPLTEVFLAATPLALCGIGVALAGKLRYWNIGAEGQLVAGALAATWCGLFAPAPVRGNAMFALVMGAAAGAAWAAIAGVLRTRLDVNESLSTLLLNYVAVLYAESLYMGAWRDPAGMGFPGTAELPPEAWLPVLFEGSRLHIGVVLAAVAAPLVAFALARTRGGFLVRAIAANPRAVAHAGYSGKALILAVACLSGAFAGLAGAVEIGGRMHRLQGGLAVGYGYTAVIVAALARSRPLGTVAAALFVAALTVGGEQLQTSLHLPAAIARALSGLVLLTALAGQVFVRYRLVITKRERVPRDPAEVGGVA